MTKLKQLFKRFLRWEYSGLCILVIITLAMHFSIIILPDKPVFDELHYVNDARRTLYAGDFRLMDEHPTLSRAFIVAGMAIFGDTPLGWRFFPVLLSTTSIALMYLICRQLSMSKRTSFLATFLLVFENAAFTFSGMAMLDIPCLTFTLLSFWLYLRGNYPLSGIAVGLAALAKLNGALAIIAIFLHWLIVRRDRLVEFLGLIIFAPVAFVFLMIPADYMVFGNIDKLPIERILTMLRSSSMLTFSNVTHSYASYPWEWIFRVDITAFTYKPNYLGVVSYTVLFLIVPAVIYMLYRAIKSKNEAGIFGLSWFAAIYLMWIPMVLITDRVTYPYYIYPVIGSICLGLGMGINQLWRIWDTRNKGKLRWVIMSLIGLYLLGHIAIFVIFSPLSYWWGTPLF
jgi:predicted membrane-bound dolichyl-phosphate-mannose-protein mannosyltransferase